MSVQLRWVSDDVRALTWLNFLISRTSEVKASSTLIRFLAEVSMYWHPVCAAHSRPSARFETRSVLARNDCDASPRCNRRREGGD